MARLAIIARAVAADWGLDLGAPFAATHSYVAPAGNGAVLKVVPPEDDESDREADALRHWDGDHAVRLLRHDPDRKAILLERVLPGGDLTELSEGDAIATVVEVGSRLWRPPPNNAPFGDVLELCRGWLDDAAGTEHEFLPHARAALATISLRTRTLVHCDFHHRNILRRADGWAAIDPKPAIGEPEYDVSTFLWNPIESEPSRDRTVRRLDAFAAAGLDRDRMRAWAIVRGTILGLPVRPGRPQLEVVRLLL